MPPSIGDVSEGQDQIAQATQGGKGFYLQSSSTDVQRRRTPLPPSREAKVARSCSETVLTLRGLYSYHEFPGGEALALRKAIEALPLYQQRLRFPTLFPSNSLQTAHSTAECFEPTSTANRSRLMDWLSLT